MNAERILREEFDCRPEQIHVLPDCVNADTFRPATTYAAGELAERRAELGIPSHRKLIVYLGLLAEYQGTDLLLEALRQILDMRQDVHLLLMGFPNEERYQQQARSLGIQAYVTFTGRVPYPQAARYLALGDVAAAPKLSLTEGAGKLLNYMAVGLPVVAFDTPVAREYLGADGVLAARGDVAQLAEKLLECLFPVNDSSSTPAPHGVDWRGPVGSRLRERAIQLYSWENAGQQIVRIYQQLLGGISEQAVPTPEVSPTRRS